MRGGRGSRPHWLPWSCVEQSPCSPWSPREPCVFVCVRVCALRVCVHWCSCGGEGWGKPSLTSVEGQGLRLEAQGCLPEHWLLTHVCALRPWPGQISGLWWGLGQAFGCPCEQLTHLFPGLMSTVVSAQGSTQAHLSSGAGYGPSERASPCQRTGCPPGRKPRGIREKGLCRMDRSFLCCEGERYSAVHRPGGLSSRAQ